MWGVAEQQHGMCWDLACRRRVSRGPAPQSTARGAAARRGGRPAVRSRRWIRAAERAERAHKSGDVAMPGDLASHAAAHWIATWWPTLVSSALFALAHVSHGPDFIPLFPFALALGYVYQRTGRPLPSMVMHFSLNLMSMLVLWMQLFGPQP